MADYISLDDDATIAVEKETECQDRELSWMIAECLPTYVDAVKTGLTECLALLSQSRPGNTLALSSSRSEALKGVITRMGADIVKCNVQVKTPGLLRQEVHQLTFAAEKSYELTQLTDVTNMLMLADSMISWADAERTPFQTVDTVLSHIRAAISSLRSSNSSDLFPHRHTDSSLFEPPLPANVTVDFSISEASVIVDFRLLELDARATDFLGRRREDVDLYSYKGAPVRVRERIRIETQDPALMSTLAKLSAIEYNLAAAKKKLDILQMYRG